jgi:branched-chain amino acid transport system permease protein
MTESKRAKSAVKPAAVIALLAVAVLLPNILGGNKYWLTIFTLLVINTLLVNSLRSVTLINEISLGHVGFALIGAYSTAILMMKGHLSFWPALILSGLLAAAISLALGHPFLKVRGIYFSILTLLTAETFRLVVYYWTGLTGGSLGLVGVPAPQPMNLFGHSVAFKTVNTYYYLALGVVVVAMLVLYHFERAYISFQWRAIRDDSMLAGAVGVNVVGHKMVNFTISAFMAAISGGLFAAFQHNLSPDTTSRFGVTMSIYLLVYMVVGGTSRFIGPLVGTTVLTLVSEASRSIAEYQPMITGGIAILVMLFLPAGLAGIPAQIVDLSRRRGGRGGPGPDAAGAVPRHVAETPLQTATERKEG